MSELIYRIYGFIHICAKRLLGRKMLGITNGIHLIRYRGMTNGIDHRKLWYQFIFNSAIDAEKKISLHYAGYVEDIRQWCLPSWVWTNAAIVRSLLKGEYREYALSLAETLLDMQEDCGGWIVRNDYDAAGAIPVLAPNDSAYIANNAMLEAYIVSREERYLLAAIKCGEWIMETSRSDGLVYVGFNVRDNYWDKECVIVDVGFTAALFAKLYHLTGDVRYRDFLQRFVTRYIQLFFTSDYNMFSTSINAHDQQQGGRFGRGQAWALEGLIPAYVILKDNELKKIIESTISSIIAEQNISGGWPYNFAHPLMGEDCKGIPIIARSLLDWYLISRDKQCLKSAQKALDWCKKHTCTLQKPEIGGIFSYTVEGGIVKNLYSSCGFVYASAYAIEAMDIINSEGDGDE